MPINDPEYSIDQNTGAIISKGSGGIHMGGRGKDYGYHNFVPYKPIPIPKEFPKKNNEDNEDFLKKLDQIKQLEKKAKKEQERRRNQIKCDRCGDIGRSKKAGSMRGKKGMYCIDVLKCEWDAFDKLQQCQNCGEEFMIPNGAVCPAGDGVLIHVPRVEGVPHPDDVEENNQGAPVGVDSNGVPLYRNDLVELVNDIGMVLKSGYLVENPAVLRNNSASEALKLNKNSTLITCGISTKPDMTPDEVALVGNSKFIRNVSGYNYKIFKVN